MSFGLPQADEEPAMPVWRVDLPADDALASRQLEQTLQAGRAQQKQLQQMPQQFDKLAAQAKSAAAQAKTPGTASGSTASFGVTATAVAEAAGAETSGPEAELLASLAQISSMALGGVSPVGAAKGVPGGVSYGLTERLGSGGLEQVAGQFQGFADRLQRTLTHLAWVETRQDGQMIGRSVVGWSGDCVTIWGQAATSAQMALHRKSLQAALQSRITLLSTFTTAVQGAVKLSVLLSTPGGAILALPTVWKYIHQILSEL